jgi:hypothetical protein
MNYTTVINRRNRIGKGAFSTAYRKGNRVIIKSKDPAKECIALFCRNMRYLPAITRLDVLDDGTAIYVMPYYEKLSKQKHPKAWYQYKIIKNIFDSNNYSDTILQKIQGSRLTKGLKENITYLVNMMRNYTYLIGLEISPRNVRVTKKGQLILLDIVFDRIRGMKWI